MSKLSTRKEEIKYSNDQIELDAQKYGYKAANLVSLQKIIEEFDNSKEAQELRQLHGDIKLGVPSFSPIDEKVIREHLDEHSPGWQGQFQQFQKAFNNQENQANLGEEAKQQLQKLQKSIIQCFKDHPLPAEIINKFLSDNQIEPDALLMVRSTGIHEDRADMANPGGNESVPCKATVADISAALGVVVASYIGEKSLSQRLGAGDKSITDMPVMPGLIQKMIGEGLDGNQFVSSGVVYTDSGSTRMQAAPGHGEYVVNSKGKVDNYYISNEGIVYSEIASKDFRLVPTISIAGEQAVSLERKDNDGSLKYSPAIDPDSAIYLHELSKFIEKKYASRVDIEFVYKPASRSELASINIVQVRAIPEASRKGLEPSALSPKFLGENKDKLQTIKGLQVITPEVNKASVITELSQVIITPNIEQALSEYNKIGQDGRTTIKAVIVEKPAPDTSHEAGVFNAGGIAVMQVKNIEDLRNLIASAEQQAIIVDPQHSKIYQLPKNLPSDEEELYKREILAKGIYASTLSNYVTPINYDFSKVKKEELSKEPVSTDITLQDQTLGQLIAKAKQGDKNSLDQLLSTAYKVASYNQEKKQGTGKDKAELLHYNIEILTSPKIGDNNKSLREALAYNLGSTIDAYKNGYINQDLFKQTIIAGTELSILLDKMEQQKEPSKEGEDKIYLEYFNILNKWAGLNINSLATLIKNHKYEELAEKLYPNISAKNKEYLIESLKLGDYLINREEQENWNKFCVNICKSDSNAECLGSLVDKLVSYRAHEQWINYIFTETNDPQQPENTLKKFAVDFSKIDLEKLKNASDIIKTMESQIGEWSDPGKFKKLYDELQENLKEINENLKLKPNCGQLEKILILQQVHHLVDIMDKSIKSLERSNLYSDAMKDEQGNNLQVARFRDMINQFHDHVMTYCMENSEYKDNQMLSRLKDSLNTKNSQQLTKSELSPSPNFNASTATIDIVVNPNTTPNPNTRPLTLEDHFTLIHQNCLVALASATKDLNQIIEQQYPDLVSQLNKRIINKDLHGNRLRPITPSTFLNLKDNRLVITHNLPLRNHSAIAEIKYDNRTGISSLEFKIFGHNGLGRWDHVALDNYLDLTKANCSFISKPYFDEEKLIVTFEVKLDNSSQITPIIEAINKSIEFSYSIHANNADSLKKILEKVIEERHQTLQFLYKNKPELKEELDKIDIIPGIPIKYDELQKIKENNIDNYKFLVENILNIATLKRAGFNAQDIADWYIKDNTREKAKFFLKNSDEIQKLKEVGFDPQDLINWYNGPHTHDKAKFLIEKGYVVNTLSEEKFFNIGDLIKLYDDPHTRNIAELLVNWNIYEICSRMEIDSKEFIKIYNNKGLETIKLLVSKNTRECYNSQWFTPQQLLHKDPKTIELLVSDNAYSYCKKASHASNYDNSMIDVEYSKLQYLLSDNAIKWYKERPCLFQELKTLPADVINGVLTQDNLETYQKAGNDCKNEKIAEIVLDEYLKYEIKDRGITQRQDDQRMLDMNHNVTSILSSYFPDIKEENIKKIIEPQISKLAANPNMELKQNIVTDIIKAIVIIEKSQKTLQANYMGPGANTGSVSTRASSPFSRLTQNFPGGR